VRNFSTPDLRVTAARIMGIESDHRTLARAGERAAREASCDVPLQPGEIVGYGSNCRWSH
jgi:hypothetical protein